MRALGLPWYGGRLPGRDKVLQRMDKAIAVAETLIEQLPAETDPSSTLGQLTEGTREGLSLATETVKTVREVLRRDGETTDIKVWRLGNETAMNLARLSMRAAENEFQRRKGDAVEKLLEAIAKEKEG